MCPCNRSLAIICGAFASMAVVALLAEDRCLDAGGRVSDLGWVCETASGISSSLWSLVSPWAVGTVVLAVGVPVYFAVSATSRRMIASYGQSHC